MDILRIRQIIIEEMDKLMEAPADDRAKEKLEKGKADIAKQKADISQQKVDLSKDRLDHDDDTADDNAAAEKDKEQGQQPPGQGQKEPEKKTNISFKTQGKFYEDAYPELRNLVLSNGNLIDEEERKYIALAVQAAEGRVDKGFDKFLRKGRAGNVYGKDFTEDDITKIIKYCRFHELVR
jgi:hypothetical protein